MEPKKKLKLKEKMGEIDNTYNEAINVLKQNITSMGFSASSQKVSNYYSVWARDHSVCVLASLFTEDKELIETSKKGILLLLRHQIENGQVPSYVEIEQRKKIYGGLGSITSIDSNMWVLIAAAALHKKTGDKRFISEKNISRYKKINKLLKAFDSNDCGLLEAHIAGDWADVFNRTYHVLYDEVLYYQSLKSLIYLFEEGKERTKSEIIKKIIDKQLRIAKKTKVRLKRRINQAFWFDEEQIETFFEDYMIKDSFKGRVRGKEYPYYQSHLTPFKIEWHDRIEIFGNILAILTGVASKKRGRALMDYILKNEINEPFPIKILDPVVKENDPDWEEIYAEKERPYEYHNGGIWPFITGFWIMSLVKRKRKRTAKKDMIKFSDLMKEQNYVFNEYLNAESLRPVGKNFQAWSAAGFIIAYHALKNHNVNPFFI
jgi:glycogen debranching enzyme